jgi:hypothetical protein
MLVDGLLRVVSRLISILGVGVQFVQRVRYLRRAILLVGS